MGKVGDRERHGQVAARPDQLVLQCLGNFHDNRLWSSTCRYLNKIDPAVLVGTWPCAVSWMPLHFRTKKKNVLAVRLGHTSRTVVTACAFARVHASVLHGESIKRLAPPRNTKDRRHLQSTQSTVNRHTSQTKHHALSNGLPAAEKRITPINTAAVHVSAQQQPAIITLTHQGQHQILSANAARCEA